MKKFLPLIVLVFIHLFFLFNLQFTAWPEMLSYPYLRNNGFLLYKDIIHPYPPVLTIALSIFFKIFGYKLEVLKVITWTIAVTNDILIFLIVKRLTKKINFSYLAVAFYILIQPFLEGNQLWFDLAIVPPILFGMYLLLKERYSKLDLFLIGVSFTLAALTKQTAGLFLVMGAAYVFYRFKNFKNVLYMVFGSFSLVVPLFMSLIQEDALIGFFNWTLVYPFTYWSKFPGYVQMTLTNYQLFVIFVLFFPLVSLLFIRVSRYFSFVICGLAISLIMVYPRFSFFHLQLALALIPVIIFHLLSKVRIDRRILVSIFLYFLLIVFSIMKPSIDRSWGKEARFWNQSDLKLSNIIKSKTSKDGTIFLLGLPSSLYIYSERIPPKPWTDNFGWYLEIPGVQEAFILRWEKEKPLYIVSSDPEPGNWHDLGTYRPKAIVDWIQKNYTKEEEIEANIWLWTKKLK